MSVQDVCQEQLNRIWEQLPLAVQDRVISLLGPNEVAGTMRHTCRAAAARYRAPQHTTLRLSRRVPTQAFAHRWAHPAAMRCLPREQRGKLLCLTAASGSVPNVQLLLPLVGRALSHGVLAAAAAAGELAMCRWLREAGCPWGGSVLEAAGRSGSRDLCEWLLAAGCPGGAQAALEGAACGGHVGLVDQLLASYGPPERPVQVVAAAAEGCDLPALRRLHATLLTGAGLQLSEDDGESLCEGAAGSPTPDWREKLEWLEAQGCTPRDVHAGKLAARCADARDRLAWAAGRGWALDALFAADSAAGRGDIATLEALLEGGGVGGAECAGLQMGIGREGVVAAAAAHGQLAVLQRLHDRGWALGRGAAVSAAGRGHLHVVAWLVEALGAEAALGGDGDAERGEVFVAAARSGSLPLLAWLRERGCLCRDGRVMDGALAGGASEEALEWLVAQGCALQPSPGTWARAALVGDTATLAWLRRVGCAWPQDARLLVEALGVGCSLPVLRWLAEAGCDVDWAAALGAARGRGADPEVVAWLAERCEG